VCNLRSNGDGAPVRGSPRLVVAPCHSCRSRSRAPIVGLDARRLRGRAAAGTRVAITTMACPPSRSSPRCCTRPASAGGGR